MTVRDLILNVLRTLWSHKLWAFFTMFGIAWGVVSIVLMVAAGEGLRKGQEAGVRFTVVRVMARKIQLSN